MDWEMTGVFNNSEIIVALCLWSGLLGCTALDGTSMYYSYDAWGNTADLTTTGGAMLNQYAYLPFGGVVFQENESIVNPFTFVGQQGVMQESDDLYFMRARYYSPSWGRFLSRDPIGLGGGDTNLYSYVQNAPLAYSDESGLVLDGILLTFAFGIGYNIGEMIWLYYNPPTYYRQPTPVVDRILDAAAASAPNPPRIGTAVDSLLLLSKDDNAQNFGKGMRAFKQIGIQDITEIGMPMVWENSWALAVTLLMLPAAQTPTRKAAPWVTVKQATSSGRNFFLIELTLKTMRKRQHQRNWSSLKIICLTRWIGTRWSLAKWALVTS